MFGVSIRLGPIRQLVFVALLLGFVLFYIGWNPFSSGHRKTSLNRLLKSSLIAAKKGGFQVKLVHDHSQLNVVSKGKTKEGANEPMTDADLKSHYAMTQTFHDEFGKGTLKIISEEHSYSDFDPSTLSFDGFSSDHDHLDLSLEEDLIDNEDIVIWIDPLDATQEFTENLLNYVTVMVCVAVKGKPVIGVIHNPFEDKTYWAWVGKTKSENLRTPQIKDGKSSELNIIVSRSHSGKVSEVAQTAFGANIKIVPAGGAGFKVLQVAAGASDAYVHVTIIKKWDICAGNAILYALGGNMTTLTGESITYNAEDNEKNENGLLATIYNHDKYLKGLKKLHD